MLDDFEDTFPHAVRLLRRGENFVVVAEHEPYFMQVYDLIRQNEKSKGTWTDEDEYLYQSAKDRKRL